MAHIFSFFPAHILLSFLSKNSFKGFNTIVLSYYFDFYLVMNVMQLLKKLSHVVMEFISPLVVDFLR